MEKFLAYMQQHMAWIIATMSVIIAAAAYYFNWRRAQKVFSYDIVTNTALISRRRGAVGKIEVSYEGKPVENLRLVEVELKNIGAIPISRGDFDEPVKITFTEGAELLETDITHKHPKSLNADFEVEGASITIKPVLLNPGDWMVVKTLVVTGKRQDPVLTAHITGIPEMLPFEAVRKRRKILNTLQLSLVITVLLTSYSYLFPSKSKDAIEVPLPIAIPIILVISLGMAIIMNFMSSMVEAKFREAMDKSQGED